MVEFIAPTLTEVGIFIIQIIFGLCMWQGYQWIKAKVEISKIKAEKERIILEKSRPKELEDLKDIQKPDTISEKLEHSLRRMLPRGK